MFSSLQTDGEDSLHIVPPCCFSDGFRCRAYGTFCYGISWNVIIHNQQKTLEKICVWGGGGGAAGNARVYKGAWASGDGGEGGM